MTHIQQAEGKGMDKQKLQIYKEGLKMAYDKLTSGLNAPPVDQLMPAAGATGGQRGGGRRPSVAQANMAGEALSESSPSQLGTINEIAAPGKPPTAA
jgi:hypothetical protein